VKPAARQHIVPCATAAAVALLVSGATVWAAVPVLGPLDAEFHWPAAASAAAGALSLAVTATATPRCIGFAHRAGPRAAATVGCLTAGALLLLALPNLTHFWQFGAALLLLGVPRALVLAGAWVELRRALSARKVVAALVVAALLGAVTVTPWAAQVVYRNSWREGVAACAGLLILIAAPPAYVLLRGREACDRGRGSP
jgi:hypothetical protein